MRKDYIFTSESVSEGHPDKVSDRISDMVVDHFIAKDPFARVACETLTTTIRLHWQVTFEDQFKKTKLKSSLKLETALKI